MHIEPAAILRLDERRDSPALRHHHAPSPMMRAHVVLFGWLAVSACTGDCATLVTKIRRCDPSAAGVSTAALALQCPGTQPLCVTMPVSTPEECRVFMGCLYGD